ncbi:MAG: hypothetical protein IT293_13580 [Deltaproteobacteria bacterium]|nr:hypothetical protein [Deltaproteobacteria bacterium]
MTVPSVVVIGDGKEKPRVVLLTAATVPVSARGERRVHRWGGRGGVIVPQA